MTARSSTCALLLAMAALASTSGVARAQQRVLIDRAQIVVNNRIMTAREVAAVKDLQRRDYQSRLKGDELAEALKNLDKTVTDKIIENLLLEIRAEELGIVVNDKEIDQRVEAITRRDPNVSDVYSEEQLKDLVYKDVLRRQVMGREVGSRVHVEDEDVKKACLASSGDDREIEVGHILVRGQDAAALEKANKIRAEVLAGADFDAEAQSKSEDPSAAANKGHLGFVSRGQFVKEFEDKAFSLKPGELSEPVRTQFGWHVIKVFSVRQRSKTDCDKLDDNARQRFYNEVYNQQSERRMAEFLESVRKTADIRVIGS